MKKIIIGLVVVIVAFSCLVGGSVEAKAKKAVVSTPKTTMQWSASGLSRVSNLRSFDYSVAIRNAYVKKVEAYARRKKIKVITAAVVDGMRE
ncbi:MAG: hypothetical protein WCO55_01035 [Candidatus Falkowbacteria bacterium]